MNWNLSEPAVDRVVPEHDFDGLSPESYPVLSAERHREVLQDLRDRFPSRSVDAFLGPALDWHRSSYGNYAKTHERTYADAFEVDAPTRNGDLIAVSPSDEQQTLARDLHELSREFLTEAVGEEITVYRGLGHAMPSFAADVLSGEQPPFDVVTTAVTNFTVDPVVARGYGLAVVETRIDVDDVLLASDFVLPLRSDGEVVARDAELRVRGDAVGPVDVTDVLFPSTMAAIFDRLDRPSSYEAAEHDEFAAIVDAMARQGVSVDAAGRDALWNWFDAYRAARGPSRRGEVLRLARQIERVCNPAP